MPFAVGSVDCIRQRTPSMKVLLLVYPEYGKPREGIGETVFLPVSVGELVAAVDHTFEQAYG